MSDHCTPKLHQLLNELKTLENWFLFGAMMDIPVSQLRKIESNHQKDSDRCKLEMLQYWLDSNSDAAWNEIVQALEKTDQPALATQIKHNYLESATVVEQEGVSKPSSASSLTTSSSTPSRRHSSTRTSLSTDAELAVISVVQSSQNKSIVESRDPNLASTMRNNCLELQSVEKGLARLSQAVPSQVQLEMQTPGRPGKPQVTEVTHNSLVLSWGKPENGADSVQSYIITYSAQDDPPGRSHTQTTSKPERTELTNLAANTTYLFKVRAESATGVSGPYSETSEPIETKCPHLDTARVSAGPNSVTNDRIKTKCLCLANKMIRQCTPSETPLGGVKAYLLPTRVTKTSGFLRITVGQSQHVAQKVLLLVGATRAGKTTLITAIANYILGVEWEDEYRFKLFSKKTEDQCITAYTFNKEDSPHPYTLTVIDTPGFGHTESGGIGDDQIVQQIKELLTLRDDEGINQLHGIGFVIQASQTLAPTLRYYMFDSILAVFGKDVADNIFLMITFADEKPPPVLDVVKAADISFSKYFKLANSSFCDSNTVLDKGDERRWQMGREKLEEFFDHFSKAQAKSLNLSRKVLQEREQLERTLQDLQSLIEAELAKIDELQQERQSLKVYQRVLQKTEEAKQSLQRLQEIALKPPADHFTKYIHTLIETEQQEALPRLSECKKALQKVQSMLKSIPKF